MSRFPIVKRRFAELKNKVNPAFAGQPECLPYLFFDTQTFTSAVTVQQNFFTAVNNDRTLSNMDAPGTLPDPQWFEIFFIAIDVLSPAVSTSANNTGNVDDILKLINQGRGTFETKISNKSFGVFPIAYAHGLGPVMADSIISQSNATSQQAGVNGVCDGGYWVGGEVVIPPKVNFTVQLNWQSTAVVLATTPVQICVQLIGVLHRRVL